MGKLFPTPTSPICLKAPLPWGSLFGVTSTILCVLIHDKYLDEVHLEHLDVHEIFRKSTQKFGFLPVQSILLKGEFWLRSLRYIYMYMGVSKNNQK